MSEQPQPAIVIPAGSVIITPSQMYEEQRATHEAVSRIETIISPVPGRLDALEGQIKALAGLPAEAADHETRLRTLERWQWKAAGMVGVLAALVGAAAGILPRLVG